MNTVNLIQMNLIHDYLQLLYICKNINIIYEASPSVCIEHKDNKFRISLTYMERKVHIVDTMLEVFESIKRYNKKNTRIINRIELNCNTSTSILYGEPYFHELKYFDSNNNTVYWNNPSFKDCLMIDSFAC